MIPAPPIALGALLPALIVFGAGVLVLLLDLLPPRTKDHLGGVALAGLVGALVASIALWNHEARAFRDMVLLDNYALFFHVVIGYAAALAVLLSIDYLRRNGIESGEYYALLLFSTSGMMLLASAGDLLIVFLGIELMSLSLYVMAGLFKQRLASGEASMKYFLLGAFATSFLLYGVALIYGATGSTNFDRIAAAAATRPRDTLITIGLGLLLVGFGFKISSVPFHMWAPDVYEGAPTSVTALIATGSKAAAFAALIRVLTVALKAAQPDWSVLLWAIAGFVAKFYLFGSAVRAGYVWLTVLGVLNSAVAAYYYLRVIVYMYMREPEGADVRIVPSFAGGVVLAIALIGIVLLGVMPAPFADLAQVAVAPLLR